MDVIRFPTKLSYQEKSLVMEGLKLLHKQYREKSLLATKGSQYKYWQLQMKFVESVAKRMSCVGYPELEKYNSVKNSK